MSINRSMHPRNIYRKPPDFNQLALQFPEFLAASSISLSGRAKINFKDENAVRTLTKCLLKRDFTLDVELPAGKLIPTVPLRLNYLLWIEDILTALCIREVRGFDIGCGASCIYPLLAAKKFGWKMIATEICKSSVETAKLNVQRNELESMVEVKHCEGTKILLDDDFAFCMCNPPFYGSSDEVGQNRTGHRCEPKSVATGSMNEIQTDGGEVSFLCRIIDESLTSRRIKVYTSMLGKRSSLTLVKKYLAERGVKEVITTEFCQGRTTRWGIAWSFQSTLEKVPQTVQKSPHCVSHIFPSNDFDRLEEFLEKIFTELRFEISMHEREPNAVTWEVSAGGDTWSHQRKRKRRLMAPDEESKFDTSFLTFSVRLVYEEPDVRVEAGYLKGSTGKDAVNQILQYMKNNFNKFYKT